MEDVGTQVAAPIVVHQPLAGVFLNKHTLAKKRGSSYPSSNFVYQNPSDTWNPISWDWDSSRFVATPLQSDGTLVGRNLHIQPDSSKKMEEQNRAQIVGKPDLTGEDDGNLKLKLGGADGVGTSGSMNSVDEPQAISRPSKRIRSGSPGSTSYPMCQVDNCKEDLSTAKDYHRRHKVCDVHSKSSEALVGKQMQRFCQQCSRFHPLSEFDEGKRSCRRRLAGHNKRRRKTQPEDNTPRSLVPGSCDNNSNYDLDIVNLLAVLAHAQGNSQDRTHDISSMPDKDHLMQILSKINLLPPLPADSASKQVKSTNASPPNRASSENQNQDMRNVTSPSTMDLLAVLSATPQALLSDASELQSQPSTEESGSEKSKSPCVDQTAPVDFPRGSIIEFPFAAGRSSNSYHYPLEDADCHVQETSTSLPLQLFSSSPEDYGARKLQPGGGNYLSSSSSNPSEGRSPLSSPPVVHELFPMRTSKETIKPDHLSASGGNIACMKATTSNGCSTSLQLFGRLTRDNENGSIQNSPYQAGYASSGSDHSPPSFISDVQDRTGRIVFKLFDKDPSQLPGFLRAQIYNWLSSSPSEMESYIRPGCIVLSLYLSMSSFAWDQLEENLHHHVKTLARDIDVDFWGHVKFLIHTDRQMASHKDGRIRVCKSLRSWITPELISVSPVAVVWGQETSLLLRGRRLASTGNKIHCTHPAGYTISLFPASSCQDTAYDEISLGSFKIDLTSSSMLGRCFIEVENNIRGTSFPVIVADATICQELRLLEPDINVNAEVLDGIAADQIQNNVRHRSREEALHFLNELGWLFQRKHNSCLFENPDYNISRFRFLLIYSVKHDFCALVKTLLGILLEFNLGRDNLASESLRMLADSHLLNKAVKRRCRSMVDLLIHYSVIDPIDNSDKFIFVPNMAGPGGVTPLHLAACTLSSEDIVDALTSDPHEIGLRCWNSVLDTNGLSPYAYALMRNNNSYNALVARKIANRKKDQVSVLIENGIDHFEVEVDTDKKTTSDSNQGRRSCKRCALVAGYSRKFPRSQGLLQQPYIHSMLLVAAVCVCVCLFLRTHPYIGSVAPFAWENLGYGTI